MHASVGDRIAVPGRHVGDAGKIGEIIDVRGQDGTPPYLIRWSDGHEGVCVPGPEARIATAERG
jgi:hypothetical protein